MEKSFIKLIENALKAHWDLPALSDYKGATYHYKDIARRIAKLHILFGECGLKRGDKVSICGRNSAAWGTVFLAVITYGAVAVPILHEFKADNVHNIVNHSDSRILFVGDVVWEYLNEQLMPALEAIILITDFSVLQSKKQSIAGVRERLNEHFGKKYPKNFRPEHVSYFTESPDDLALINYTSGTTGFSKGVMLPYRSLHSNLEFAYAALDELKAGDSVVAMLPTAHMYGMSFEFLFEISKGCHVQFLTRLPTPKIILEAFAETKPRLIITVPLIIEKIYRNSLLPLLRKPSIRALLSLPVVDRRVLKAISKKLNATLGGNFLEVVIGGAAFNQEAERFFRKIGFRYTVGYGMTECGPIISYEDWSKTPLYSCGKSTLNMQVRIASPDPQNVVGEVQVQGKNVMLGYYKNPETTQEAFTADGWLRTGDLGVMDKNGYLYLKGRSKNMIVGASGQNIYLEEIEDKINNRPYVAESLVVESSGKLLALVYPDYETLAADEKNVEAAMAEMLATVNASLPAYSRIAGVKTLPEEFEKTPKRSIKRFMYQLPQS
ncbi:MAG: AMP-binding protein [Prevotellaceae bacterium]|jgi:long-chain acyl-CoA synthetase|nr:AMP-binding protein [Prevotellaceae bacterium]